MTRDTDQLEAKIRFWREFVSHWEESQDKTADERIMELLDDLEEHLRGLTAPRRAGQRGETEHER
jgi:hypothetical protein